MKLDIRVVENYSVFSTKEIEKWKKELKNRFGDRFISDEEIRGAYEEVNELYDDTDDPRIGWLFGVRLSDIVIMQNEIFTVKEGYIYQLDIDSSANGIMVIVIHNGYRE